MRKRRCGRPGLWTVSSILLVTCVIARSAIGRPGFGASSAETLVGTVVGPDGNAIAGACVRIAAVDQNSAGPANLECRTDAVGCFKVKVPEAFYRNIASLVAEADGYASMLLTRMSLIDSAVTTNASGDLNLGKLTLDRGRVFSGRVSRRGRGPGASARHADRLHQDPRAFGL